MLNGAAEGLAVDPELNNAGGGGTIGNADNLNTLTAYQLESDGSPVRHAGLNPSQFGITWDPYAYASDPFMRAHFSTTPTDYYGDPLPTNNSSQFGMGADILN